MDASLDNPRALLRGELTGLAATLAKDEPAWDELLATARAKVGELDKPGFFTFATTADIPPDLKWETNLDAPEIGSPDAKKGGTFHQWMPAFPPSLRVVGSRLQQFVPLGTLG